jgi:hypothetical protein
MQMEFVVLMHICFLPGLLPFMLYITKQQLLSVTHMTSADIFLAVRISDLSNCASHVT